MHLDGPRAGDSHHAVESARRLAVAEIITGRQADPHPVFALQQRDRLRFGLIDHSAKVRVEIEVLSRAHLGGELGIVQLKPELIASDLITWPSRPGEG